MDHQPVESGKEARGMTEAQLLALVKAHLRMVMETIRAELEHNRWLLEAQATDFYPDWPLSTKGWDRYQAHIRPTTPVGIWLTCKIKGHIPDLCERTCCDGQLEWCSRCGAVRPAGTRERTRKPSVERLTPVIA